MPVILVLIPMLAGVAMIAYPIVSNLFYETNRSQVTTEYEKQVEDVKDDEVAALFSEANKYNESLLKANVILTDPFDPSVLENEGNAPYRNLLNYSKDGIMGYVSIPVINLELPIYHGTSTETLEKGIGHLEQTSLPVGGIGTHSVLTGHSGLAGKRLFTDLPELKEGDVFYIRVLNEIMAYKVVKIAIVEPKDTSLLRIDRTRDLVTLLTCYPFGVNSHRFLVTGERVEIEEAASQEQKMERETRDIWKDEYKKAVLVCIAVYVPLFIAGLILIRMRRKKNKK